eukprot:7504659-Alexandrium_andersonii.AAC.1
MTLPAADVLERLRLGGARIAAEARIFDDAPALSVSSSDDIPAGQPSPSSIARPSDLTLTVIEETPPELRAFESGAARNEAEEKAAEEAVEDIPEEAPRKDEDE